MMIFSRYDLDEKSTCCAFLACKRCAQGNKTSQAEKSALVSSDDDGKSYEATGSQKVDAEKSVTKSKGRYHCCCWHIMTSWLSSAFRILALLKGNPPVTLHKGPAIWSFDVNFVVSLTNLLNKQPSCRNLRRLHSCDFTVMKNVCLLVVILIQSSAVIRRSNAA